MKRERNRTRRRGKGERWNGGEKKEKKRAIRGSVKEGRVVEEGTG